METPQPPPTWLPATATADEAITVLVVDAAALPIADAEVVLIADQRDFARTRTARDGRAVFATTPLAVACRASAFGWLPVQAPLPSPGQCVRVELQRAPCVHGRVFAPDGLAMPGVEFVLLPAVVGRRGLPPALPPQCRTVRSDARGDFRLPFPIAMPHDLIGWVAGCAPLVMPALQPSDGDVPLWLTLIRGARLCGEARHGDTRLANVAIELWLAPSTTQPVAFGPDEPWHGGQLLARTTTDHRGDFTFAELPEGRAWLTLAEVPWRGHVEVPLARGESRQVTLPAVATARLHGTVDGEVAGWRVFVFGGPALLHTPAIAVDGAFTEVELPPGRYLVGVAAEPIAPALHAALQHFQLDGRTDLAEVVTLQAGEQRELRLTSPAPVHGALTGMAFVAGVPAREHRVVLETVPSVGARRRTVNVRDDGSFELAALSAGEWQASLWAQAGGAPLATAPCRVLRGAVTQVTLAQP